jgi:hypothetical protein
MWPFEISEHNQIGSTSRRNCATIRQAKVLGSIERGHPEGSDR